MKNKKLVIFDFDGTLIDSVPDLSDAVNYTLKEMGLQPYEEEVIRSWVGNGAATLIKRALVGETEIEDIDIGNNIFEKALDIFLDYYASNLAVKTYLYEGVQETLKILKLNNIKMAIVTNKPYEFIEPITKALGIAEYFELSLGANSLPKKKPDPQPLLHVMKELGFEAEESVMVGDSKNDILAAHAAEVESIAVTYGYNYGEDIEVHSPSVTVGSFAEIAGVLGIEK